MNGQGAARRGREDDWWRQLYGEDGRTGSGPSDAPDTLDDRVASALRALGPPARRRRGGRAEPSYEPAPEHSVPSPARRKPWEPPVRRLPPPPVPSAPIPLQATGPDARPGPAGWSAPPPLGTDFVGARPFTYGPEPLPYGLEPLAYGPESRTHGPEPSGYEPEPATLPAADPAALDEQVPDTALDGAHYGSLTLRAASQRGDSARHRGEVRRDTLLTARFGTGRHALILAAVATGGPAADGAHRAARDVCAWIGGAVGRSYTRLAADIRSDNCGALKSGLQRLTDRGLGKLRGRERERGAPAEPPTAALRCLLLPADPDCRTRVFFGVGEGGLFRLRDGAWQDLEPATTEHDPHDAPPSEPSDGGSPRPAPGLSLGPRTLERPVPAEPFLFRTVFTRPGDALLLCSAGLAEPLHEEPAFAARLAVQWSTPEPPGLVPFLAAAQLRAMGHTKDRTAVGVWES
ncbi:protein phosphatase 2C domain-containing protein [Streptomyces sp. NPDC001339]|uniref:protein phosphatase 2C domain-containing protein n=1 Tax=Streptomyces sp. NPDC001339 TaxID=3364563 RepID=UPI0036A6F924